MSDWAAKVLDGVPRHGFVAKYGTMEKQKDGYWLHVDDALAAIARMGAGDGLVERLLAYSSMDDHLSHRSDTERRAAAHIAALTAKVARLEGALTDMPKAVLRTTVCQGPVWPDDRPGVWLAALEACAKSVQAAVDAALTDGGSDD